MYDGSKYHTLALFSIVPVPVRRTSEPGSNSSYVNSLQAIDTTSLEKIITLVRFHNKTKINNNP